MRRMRWIAALFGALACTHAFADEPVTPIELVHVPVDELNVLLQSQKRGLVLEYKAYRKLFEQARARVASLAGQPPVDGTLVAAAGRIDLVTHDADERPAARIEAKYDVRVLADGPRSVPFVQRNLAFESVQVEGQGQFEEWRTRPRLRFEGAGNRTVRVQASAVVHRKGAQRLLHVVFPSASSMAFDVVLPAGIQGYVYGEGAPFAVNTEARETRTVRARPARDGSLRVIWAPAAKGTSGPPILDGSGSVIHRVGDGVIRSRMIVHADVYRVPVTQLDLEVPADFAVHALTGKGVARYARLEDRERIRVHLQAPTAGRVTLTLQGERPFQPGKGVVFPNAVLADAVWHWTDAAVQGAKDVNVRGVNAVGGRRVRSAGQAPYLRYHLARADARLEADIESGLSRTESVSTYYLNLAEAGKNLLITTTYRVLEGTVFALHPTVPTGFELRTLQINGRTDGFTRDVRADGTIDVLLQRGVPQGGEVLLAATLEQARTDWVPEQTTVEVPFRVPSAGADREEGLLGLGADAAFEVLEQSRRHLVAVGAADLTARGVAPEGLVYGYRLDGEAPEVTYQVRRRDPVIEAQIVSQLKPTPRRLDVVSVVTHDIRRAGVREVLIDVPAWAGDQVRFVSPFVRATEQIESNATPAGYARWRVTLRQRLVGRQTILVQYFHDFDEDDWRVPVGRPLGARVPLERVEAFSVVHRADGLEVQVDRGAARAIEVTELPAEAATDVLKALDVVRLADAGQSLGLQVRKHEGAAVLNAVATLVELNTAVSREGVLRTHAKVHLFNIDRQFLAVGLPPNSLLIGAIADGKPVKPLTRPDGAVLIPITTARDANARAVVALTYQTNLDEALSGSVDVPAPQFPGLEVLETAHRVAFDPDVRVHGISGDFEQLPNTRGAVAARAPRKPWVLGLFERSAAGVVGSDAAAPARPSLSSSVDDMSAAVDWERAANTADTYQTDNDVEATLEAPIIRDQAIPAPKPEAEPAAARERIKALQSELATLQAVKADDKDARRLSRIRKVREHLDQLRLREAEKAATRAAVPAPVQPGQFQDPGGGVAPGMREPHDPAPNPPPVGPDVVIVDAPDVPGDRAAGGPGEGGAVPTPPRFRGRARTGQRRKGLLSLDVPVVLGPNQIVARRMGAGGVMTISLQPPAENNRTYPLLLALFAAVGMWCGRRSAWDKFLVVCAGVGVAALMALTLGASAADWSSALTDAATLCLGLWLVAWIVQRVFVPHTLTKATSALVLCALALASVGAGAARADEPRPKLPPIKDPKRVFVPYDPAHPGRIEDNARVFLPFDTWETLFRAANPDLDPEIVRLGRMVTVTDVETTITVGEKSARGHAVVRFEKRGSGMLLTAWPFGGLAITEATLDGEPVELLLTKGVYRMPVTAPGAHELVMRFRVPLTRDARARRFGFRTVPFSGARLHVRADAFDGTVEVNGAGRVEERAAADSVTGRWVVAHLGHARRVQVALRERRPEALPTTVRMRGETRTIHSLRDGGTVTRVDASVHVLQGAAPFLDFALPATLSVLDVRGPQIASWEPLRLADGDGPPDTLRLVFAKPQQGRVQATVRVVHPAVTASRTEGLPGLVLRDVTGESGQIVVNHDTALRVEVTQSQGLFRLARPKDKTARGPGKDARVMGAWRFSTRPVSLQVRSRRVQPRLEMDATNLVVFGDDHVRTALRARVRIQRAPVGQVTFALPGTDDVRAVLGPKLDAWWLEGEGEMRRLRIRFQDLVQGDVNLAVTLSRRLGGVRHGLAVPRWSLEGAQRDRCQVVLYALRDVEPVPGALPGLRSVPLVSTQVPPAPIDRARPTHVFERERPMSTSLPLVLRTPDLSVQAVVVSLVAPAGDEHRIEHLVLYDIERGSTDHLQLFVPDGGASTVDVIRTRDLREQRGRRATRTGPDGVEVEGTLYDILLQSQHAGVVAVTVTQIAKSDRPVRLVRPENVAKAQWFSLVRTYLDGQVDVSPLAGSPDPVAWGDLPFLPTGVEQQAIVSSFVGRTPYALTVVTTQHDFEKQADAVVLSADARVVLGMDGHARVRMRYRVFNRARQFLRVRLPAGAVLFGASSAGVPVKPLAGAEGTLLLPVPKVPLGGLGHPVTVLFRARVGEDFERTGSLRLLLPGVEEVEVDRTIVRLFVPEGFDYDFETTMTAADADEINQELAEAALFECRGLLEVADTGTLTQRVAATANAQRLLAQAEQLQSKRSDPRAQALGAEIAQVRHSLARRDRSNKRDQGVALQGQSIAVTQDEFGGNAANLVELGDGKDAPAGGKKSKANFRSSWRYNDAPEEETTKGAKADLGQLKQHFKKELKKQQLSDHRLSNIGKMPQQQGRSDAEKTGDLLQSQADANFDYNQLAWLNGQLRQAQEDNRQLGTNAGNPYAGGQIFFVQPEATRPLPTPMTGSGGGAGGAFQGRGRRSFAGEGIAGGGDGGRSHARNAASWYARKADELIGYTDIYNSKFVGTEQQGGMLDLTASGNISVFGTMEAAQGRGGLGIAPVRKSGLMGVDVPLPEAGRVFYFKSGASGAPIEIEVSKAGLPFFARLVMFLAILAALVTGVVVVARRRAAAA